MTVMQPTRLSGEEVARRGEELYQESLRDKLEADPENIGKIVVVDLESGDYEVDDFSIAASKRLQARHPDGHRYAMRIGYDAVYGFGRPPQRVKR
jgi:hypothetical protein